MLQFAHTYRYAEPSSVDVGSGAAPHLRLATSSPGEVAHPHFFEGRLHQPQLAAQLLSAVHLLVGSRFFTPANSVAKAVALADPVVTAGSGMLRLEGFSACCSTYIRVDLEPAAYAGDIVGKGTTNIDFNAPMRAALAQVRDADGLALSVGSAAFTLHSGGAQVVEKKVELPLRWLRSMVAVQTYQSAMRKVFEVDAIPALRFVRGLPRASTSKTPLWVVAGPQGLRTTAQNDGSGVRFTDSSRLRVLENLLPKAEAATPLVSATAKGQVLAALGLLGQVAKNDAALAHQASGIAALALGHTAADVHKKAIAFLAKWGLDDAGRELARGYLSFVSAVNRPALAALVGEADAAPTAMAAATPGPAQAPRRISPLDASRALAPLEWVADVVERMAYVLENPADVDEWERVAGALVRLAPITAADKAAFLALQKRSRKLEWPAKPLPFALARVMAAAVDGEGTAEDVMRVPGDAPTRAEHFIGPRVQGLIAQALAGQGLTPLSTPTHRGGFIDPRQLVQRIQAQLRAGVMAPLSEQVLALMRLVPAPMDETAARTALAEAQGLTAPAPLVQALRYALGDGTVKVPADAAARPLFLAAARVRSPHADDAPTLAAYGDLGPDGPLHPRLGWHVLSRSTEYGYTFHHLYLRHQPRCSRRSTRSPTTPPWPCAPSTWPIRAGAPSTRRPTSALPPACCPRAWSRCLPRPHAPWATMWIGTRHSCRTAPTSTCCWSPPPRSHPWPCCCWPWPWPARSPGRRLWPWMRWCRACRTGGSMSMPWGARWQAYGPHPWSRARAMPRAWPPRPRRMRPCRWPYSPCSARCWKSP